MFSLSSQAMGRAECQPLLGCALPMDFSLHLDSYKYLRNCHFFQTPVGLKDKEASFGILWRGASITSQYRQAASPGPLRMQGFWCRGAPAT